MSETTREKAHTHCWHTPDMGFTRLSYPPQHEEVCCHCGARQWVSQVEEPVPDGHGPHYPRRMVWPKQTVAWNTRPDDPTRHCSCRPENGGNGVCGCVLGGVTIR